MKPLSSNIDKRGFFCIIFEFNIYPDEFLPRKESLLPPKTFLEKVVENTFVVTLTLAVKSFVASIIMYIMGVKGRLFFTTIFVRFIVYLTEGLISNRFFIQLRHNLVKLIL